MNNPAKPGKRAAWAALLCAAVALHTGVLIAQPENAIFAAGEGELMPVIEIPPAMGQRGVIRLANLAVPSSLFILPPASEPVDPVVIPIDLGREVQLVERSRRVANGKTYVFGVVEGFPNSRFVMLLDDGALQHGEIRLPNEVINLTAPQASGDQIIFRLVSIDPSLQPDPREPVERILPDVRGGRSDPRGGSEEAPELSPNPPGPADTPTVVKIMVVYTEAAREAFDIFNTSSSWDIEDEIEWAVLLANYGFESQGKVTLELVHIQEVQYKETGDIAVDLERLACPCDHKKKGIGSNHLNEVFAPWKAYEADLVSLWVDYYDQPGMANIMSTVSTNFAPLGVSVVDWGAAVLNFSFEHEIGHNFGARHHRKHDWEEGKPYDYNHGWVNITQQAVTIMSYRKVCDQFFLSCDRVAIWSDPDYLPTGAWGVASGVDAADNARTLQTSAPTVGQLFEQGEDLIGCCVNYGGWINQKWRPGKCN